jgi:hypothetical protein
LSLKYHSNQPLPACRKEHRPISGPSLTLP